MKAIYISVGLLILFRPVHLHAQSSTASVRVSVTIAAPQVHEARISGIEQVPIGNSIEVTTPLFIETDMYFSQYQVEVTFDTMSELVGCEGIVLTHKGVSTGIPSNQWIKLTRKESNLFSDWKMIAFRLSQSNCNWEVKYRISFTPSDT